MYRSLTHSLSTVPTLHRLHLSYSNAGSVMTSIEDWLFRAAGSTVPAVKFNALRALQGFSLATGSQSALLRLAEACAATPTTALPDDFSGASKEYLKKLSKEYFTVCDSASFGDGGAVSGALFSSASGFKSSGAKVTKGGRNAESTGGGNEYCLVNYAFRSGRGAWEFKLERDSVNGECVCMGAATKPVNNTSYERSNDLWMYRGYNGNLYHGRQLSTMEKYHPGDTVRFELDLDAGTLSIGVNGKKPVCGVVQVSS